MEGVCAKVTTDSALDRPSHRQHIQEHEKCALGCASLYLCNFFRAMVLMSVGFSSFSDISVMIYISIAFVYLFIGEYRIKNSFNILWLMFLRLFTHFTFSRTISVHINVKKTKNMTLLTACHVALHAATYMYAFQLIRYLYQITTAKMCVLYMTEQHVHIVAVEPRVHLTNPSRHVQLTWVLMKTGRKS